MRIRRAALLAAAVCVLPAGCASAPRPATPRAAAPRPAAFRPPAIPVLTPVQRPAARPPASLPVAPGAAALPQTSVLPRHNGAAFHNAMSDLWLAVTTGRAAYALPAFFPLRAYERLKAIPYPEPDWRDRLWADFTLDVDAAHRLVGHGARLLRVIVPSQYAEWVDPGVCANSIGYWHVPGSRVVYERGGVERSFGIASLISWRGVWYVVHFGAVLRSYTSGLVDDPVTGPGTPGPPGGC